MSSHQAPYKTAFTPHKHMRTTSAIAGLLILLLGAPATALGVEGAVSETNPSPEFRKLRVGVKGGVSTFLNSKSYRPAHFMRPTTRVEVATPLDGKREVGLELVGTRSGNENYNLLGALAFARAAMYTDSNYELSLRGGFGCGTGPKILFKDLSYEKAVIPWGQFGVDMSWEILSDMRIGSALLYENMSVLSVLLTLDFNV